MLDRTTPDAERYSIVRNMRDWQEYVGDETTPVIVVTVDPKKAETVSSALTRGLTASMFGIVSGATLKYQGDVHGLVMRREGMAVTPLQGGHAPKSEYIDNQWVALRDIADEGFYAFAPEAFAPLPSGTPPKITLEIDDLKHPEVRARSRSLPTPSRARGTTSRGTFGRRNPRMPFAITRSGEFVPPARWGAKARAVTCYCRPRRASRGRVHLQARACRPGHASAPRVVRDILRCPPRRTCTRAPDRRRFRTDTDSSRPRV